MANIFSGAFSLFKVFPNSNLNVVAKSATYSAFNFALSKTLGNSLANKLGISSTGNSNFLPTVVSPGLISTGTEGLSQLITNSVRNSKALGPFGQLAGNILESQVNNIGGIVTNTLFGGVPSNSTLYFPGAGGMGEGEADFPLVDSFNLLPGSEKKKQMYALGVGKDVVFAIVPAGDAARYEAEQNTVKQPAPTASPSPGPAVPGAIPDNTTQSAANAAPAANPPAPTPAPAQAVSGSGNQGVNPATSDNTEKLPNAAIATSVPLSFPGLASARNFPVLPESTSGTPEAAQTVASQNTVTQPSGANVGDPTAGSTTSGVSTGTTPVQTAAAEQTPPASWKFICPPEDISWETTFQADRVPIFGMNDAPVVGGTKSMRDLTLNNSIVEGFTRGKTVEDKIKLLEDLMRMKMGQGANNSFYVQVPVYKVFAGGKPYGQGNSVNEAGFFIIKSVKVQEKMRDQGGRTTRALVDISLTQVPSYQVDSGRDQASAFLASQVSPADTVARQVRAGQEQLVRDVSAAAANAARNSVNSQAGQTGSNGGTSNGGATPSAAPTPRAPTTGAGSTPTPNGRNR